MKVKQYITKYLPIVAVGISLVGSFYLPNAVANVMDARTLDNLMIIEAENISFETELNMSIPDRIALLSNPFTEMLSIATGQTMNMELARESAIRELQRFFGGKLIEFDVDDCTAEDGNAVFVIETDNPTVNLIIWEFRVFDGNGNEVNVSIDDETGIILKLIYQRRNALNTNQSNTSQSNTNTTNNSVISKDELYSIALEMTEMMSDYYGVPVRLGDYQLGANIAYYRADLFDRGMVIPMYGVVRSNSLTMNERL
ncbi:MAG: hypothetical protein FWG88_04620 [Oscillospiraceae bacterium]|nr:hypothetical protein [Oscillospiraceae bacterium]